MVKQQTGNDALLVFLRSASEAQACEMVDASIRERRIDDAVELWRAITATSSLAGRDRFPYPQVARRIEDGLVRTAGTAYVDALFTLAAETSAETGLRSPARQRDTAFLLGQYQNQDTLVAAIARFGHDQAHQETLACWMYEGVLHGYSLEHDRVVQAFHASLVAREHPLAYLPLSLIDVEREAPAYLSRYGPERGRRPDPFPRRAPDPPTRSPGLLARATHVDARAVEHRLREAVRHWEDHSNGSIEAKSFRIEPSIAGLTPGPWLLRLLALDCLKDAASIETNLTGANTAWLELFANAASAGAYSSMPGGAYGRSAAWTSFSALVGAPADQSLSATASQAQDCSFLTFVASSPWFHGVAWDFGILAVRSDGETVAILAASDTD